MIWQLVLTTLIVAACAAYALWSLLPAAWRRRRLAAWRGQPAPTGSGACGGCDGCGGEGLPPPRTAQDPSGDAAPVAVIHFVRRPAEARPAPTDPPARS